MTILDVLEPALAPWVHPIADDAPLGPDPRPLPAYQSLREEIAKLESPAAGPCRWELVERDAALVLSASKDLASAAYLAGALAQRRGIEGLALGTTLLAQLLRRFDTLHPARPRARANALTWFLDRAEQQALAARPSASDRAHLARLEAAITALRGAAGERLGDDAPGTHRFAEAVQRLVLSLPPEASLAAPAMSVPSAASTPAPAAATATGPASAPTIAPTTIAATATVAAPALPPAPDAPTDSSRVPQFLAQIGASLCTTSAALRAARAHDPEAVRLFLAGLYLPVVQVPPRARERRTGLPGPASALRTELERLRREGDPPRLFEVATRALEKHRFWLDLHVAIHEALRALGASAREARELHANEIRSLVARLPGLLDAELADGTPFASDETRSWLETLAGPASASTATTASDSALEIGVRDARELLRAGKSTEALSRAQEAVRVAVTARDRFVARLELAAIALDAKFPAVSLALSAELHREATDRDLAEWDAQLAARACALYLRAAASERNPALLPIPHGEVYARLCLLDPATAASLSRA